ncbi:acyltransferase family protein [Rhodospirillaceae bacterium SYSU D60014]|uniref:acyltransferase family protein n=1 Tax=Virgifigura deserti TaxID=2268457 RepID=UPI000E66FE54
MTRDIHALTSLRGVAALSVATLHVHRDFGYSWNFAGHTLYIEMAYLWVDFFFILSGFVMSHVYAGDFTHGVTAKTARRFLAKRFARIYPLHLLTLCFFWAWAITKLMADVRTSGHVDPAVIPIHLFMMQGWGWLQDLYWNYPAWSVSAEVAAYLLFPWLCLFVGWGPRSRSIATAFGCVVGLALLQALESKHSLKHATYDTGVIRCLFEFVLGMLLYRAYGFLSASRRMSWIGGDAIAFGGFGALVMAMHFGAPELAIIGACALVILSGSLNQGGFSRFFALPPLLWLGSASYAIYMLHAPLLAAWGPISTRLPQEWIGSPLLAATYLAVFMMVLLSVAGLTHRFFEVPARTHIYRFTSARFGGRASPRLVGPAVGGSLRDS